MHALVRHMFELFIFFYARVFKRYCDENKMNTSTPPSTNMETVQNNVLIVSCWDDWWACDGYQAYDASYFVILLILFLCCYIILSSYICTSRAISDECNSSDKNVRYVIVKITNPIKALH